MRQAMQSIPNEFIEAGRIDGASEFMIFWRLILPQAKASLSVGHLYLYGTVEQFSLAFDCPVFAGTVHSSVGSEDVPGTVLD